MKAAEWARVSAPLREALTAFRPMRFGLVHEGEWVAKGIHVETSAFRADRVFIDAFTLPLFIPTKHLTLTYGFRIGHQWERVDAPMVRAVVDAMLRLDAFATSSAVVERAHNWQVNVRHAELRLCIAVLEGDRNIVCEVARTVRDWSPQRAWEKAVIARTMTIADLARTSGPEAAVTALAARREAVRGVLR